MHVLAVAGNSAILGGPRTAAALAYNGEVRLSFIDNGHPVALGGTISPGPMDFTVRFIVTTAHVRQRRASSRLPLDLTATVLAEHSDHAVTLARVADISTGGLGLRGFTAPEGARVTVVLRLPPDDRVLRIGARVTRAYPDGVGLRFEPLPRETRESIEHLVLTARIATLYRLSNAA